MSSLFLDQCLGVGLLAHTVSVRLTNAETTEPVSSWAEPPYTCGVWQVRPLCVPTSARHYCLVSREQTFVVRRTPPRKWKDNRQDGREEFQGFHLIGSTAEYAKPPDNSTVERQIALKNEQRNRTEFPQRHTDGRETPEHAQRHHSSELHVEPVVKRHCHPLSGCD